MYRPRTLRHRNPILSRRTLVGSLPIQLVISVLVLVIISLCIGIWIMMLGYTVSGHLCWVVPVVRVRILSLISLTAVLGGIRPIVQRPRPQRIHVRCWVHSRCCRHYRRAGRCRRLTSGLKRLLTGGGGSDRRKGRDRSTLNRACDTRVFKKKTVE